MDYSEGKGKRFKTLNSHSLQHSIVEKFIKPDRIDWRREMVNARRLVSKYPDDEFWDTLNLSFGLNTLTFFFRKQGEEILKSHQKAYAWKPKRVEKIVLEKTKVGSDFRPKRNKFNNLKEFLEKGAREK